MRSSLVFAALLGLTTALLVWWATFQFIEAEALERVGTALRSGDADAAARALGATDCEGLTQLASSRRRMFLSEAIVFAAALIACGFLYVRSKRAERRVLQSHVRFLTGATHELKTPLATIRLGLESLAEARVDVATRERYVQAMLGETARLERGLGNLLETAALRAEGVVLHLAKGDLREDLRLGVGSLASRADAAGVRVELDATESTVIDRDAKAIGLVLHNLLDNAVKFSPRGGVVHASLRCDGRSAKVCIADEGTGIAADDLPHIFEPFWRGDHAAGGAGLGLHLARELVHAHGGRIDAHSEGVGCGARFEVSLPMRGVRA